MNVLRIAPAALVAVVVVLVVAGASAAADELAPTIAALHVEGNERTASEVILRAAEIAPGTAYSDDLPETIRQRVYNLRVFDAVSVEPARRGGAIDLTIRVRERWTLLPIPFASAGNDVYRFGMFVVDTNFLGRHKTALAGGYYGNRGSGVFLFYLDPEIEGSRFQATLQAAYFGARREQYDGGAVAYAFSERRAEAALGIGYRLTRALSVAPGWEATQIDPTAEPGYAMPDAAGVEHGPTLQVDLDASDFKLYFQEGVQNRLRVETSVAGLGSARSFVRVEDKLQLATGVGPDHALIATARGQLTTSDSPLDAFLLGGEPGTRGFRNQGLWARDAATLALEYQIPVWRPSWGVWTVLGFVDAGTARVADARQTFVQPGAGLRMYLRQIALPALGVDLAYSPDEGGLLAAMSIGLSL